MRRLTGPGYILAGVLVVIPFLHGLAHVGPLNPLSLAWRLETMTQLSAGMLLIASGLLLIAVIAMGTRDHTLRKVLTIVYWLLGAILVSLFLIFMLDAVRMRGRGFPMVPGISAAETLVDLGSWLMIGPFTLLLAQSLRRRRSPTAPPRPPMTEGDLAIVSAPAHRRRRRS